MAECNAPNHGRCTKTRKGRLASGIGTTLTGRPLVFLFVWLRTGCACEERAEHYDPIMVNVPFEIREAARRDLATHDGASDLLRCEKGGLEGGEPAESD